MSEASPQARYLGKLLAEIPQPRLLPYLRAAKGDTRRALAWYYWNVELCRAFYPALHALEIGLRNAVDRAIVRYLSEQKTRGRLKRNARLDSWLTDGDPAVNDSAPACLIVHRQARVSVVRALDEILPTTPSSGGTSARGRDKTHGDLVAKLPFGFWTSLLAEEYGPKAKSPADLAWQDTSQGVAFAGSTHIDMPEISRRFNAIRHFRNRVFHYEPIWPKYPSQDNPDTLYTAVLAALRLIGGVQADLPPVLHGRPKELDMSTGVELMDQRLAASVDTLLARAADKAAKSAKGAAKPTPSL